MTDAVKKIIQETVASLKGYAKRHLMAQVVKELYDGHPTPAERELGWNRVTLRKALAEWDGQFCYIDRYYERGRKKAEEHQPNLLADIQQIADSFSQTDATFATTQLYTRLSAAAVREQLVEQKGYTAETVPSEDTIRRKLNTLGYKLKAVKKNQPLKKLPETAPNGHPHFCPNAPDQSNS